ncbi:MAG: FtsX-like permease family protein [Haliscomenobacter sp.]|nr:FtsX-like permease family protein [Haliscomenobacter sp.]
MFKTAYRFLVYDKAKSIGAMSGVILSVFLIGQQSGIFIFLTDAMSSLVRNNAQYIWVIDDKTTNANSLSALDMRKARELASVPGVTRVNPMVLAGGTARFANGKTSGIQMIGTQYPEWAGGPWNLETGKKTDLLQDGAVMTEYFDRDALGDAVVGDYFEINGKQVYIAGNTRGVRSFGGVYVFTTIERARFLGGIPNDKANAFLLQWDPNTSRDQIIYHINTHLKGLRAWKSEELTSATISEVLKSSGIGFSVGTLIVFALITGFVIIGLTLYSAAIDRIKDYGTLKAIGATNGYIRRLILTQAITLALVGFVLGFALVMAFKNGIAQAGTLFEFPLWLQAGFVVITLLIAFTGSWFAIRRITGLEPSAIFRI